MKRLLVIAGLLTSSFVFIGGTAQATSCSCYPGETTTTVPETTLPPTTTVAPTTTTVAPPTTTVAPKVPQNRPPAAVVPAPVVPRRVTFTG